MPRRNARGRGPRSVPRHGSLLSVWSVPIDDEDQAVVLAKDARHAWLIARALRGRVGVDPASVELVALSTTPDLPWGNVSAVNAAKAEPASPASAAPSLSQSGKVPNGGKRTW